MKFLNTHRHRDTCKGVLSINSSFYVTYKIIHRQAAFEDLKILFKLYIY